MKRRRSPHGIALFILLSSVVILSLLMRELIQSSSNQAFRVRNSVDRIQALYLARSSVNLARFILYLDNRMDLLLKRQNQEPADTLFADRDFWNTPNYFPLKREEIMALTQAVLSPDQKQDAEEPNGDLLKKCEEFFGGFPGTATSITQDMAGRLYLQDLSHASKLPLQVLTELLRPNSEFLRHLDGLRISPEALAREIRDYMDPDSQEDESGTAESMSYTSMNLDYEPKNRPFIVADELKRVPHVDDTVFSHLVDQVNPYFNPSHASPKINVNTVSAILFQSLLKDRADAADLAQKFVKDRAENKRVYSDANMKKELLDALQLSDQEIQYSLLTGVSDSFKIETTATVNQIVLQLETILVRASSSDKLEKVRLMRVSP